MRNYNLKSTGSKIVIVCLMFATLALVSAIIIGCAESAPPPPPKPINDISEHSLYHTGTVVGIDHGDTGFSNSSYFYYVQYSFDDGTVIRMFKLKCDHIPKVGEYGNLYIEDQYKNYSHTRIHRGHFLWIKDIKLLDLPAETESIDVGKMVAKAKQKHIKAEINETPKKIHWKDADYFFPNIYELVLIKLDDDIITTGRLTDENQWKIEIDKKRSKFNKYQNARVVKWKELDID